MTYYSIATTSIVGYIVSLGDRHCHNLLLDEKTAEMIHIDFGKFCTYKSVIINSFYNLY